MNLVLKKSLRNHQLKELEENDLLEIVVLQQAIVKIRFIKNNSNICWIMKNQK